MAQNIIPNINFDTYERDLLRRDESYWIKRGRRRAFSLFKRASELVPAYRDFLKKNHVQSHRMKSVEDFSHIPLTSKENYIQIYSLQKRCWNGELPASGIIAASSGTSGNQNFWIRDTLQEQEAVRIHAFIYRHLLGVGKKRTLIVVGFPMGVYVSGIATLLPTWSLADVCGMTIMGVGNSKDQILSALRHVSSIFDHIIFAGHPFFIKSVLETAAREHIMRHVDKISLLLCSEGFSESWRTYMKNLLQKHAASVRIISVYGSAEFLLMAFETDASIRIKEQFEKDGKHMSVFQYDPTMRYIEIEQSEIICTGYGAAPLIRYNMHDSGSLVSEKEVTWHLPFVALQGRSDYTLIFHGVNLYPEHIRQALDNSVFHKKITGKFVMQKSQNSHMDIRLVLHVELQPHQKKSRALEAALEKHIMKHLTIVNKEYKDMIEHISGDVLPHVRLCLYEDPVYFKQGLKPKYILT